MGRFDSRRHVVRSHILSHLVDVHKLSGGSETLRIYNVVQPEEGSGMKRVNCSCKNPQLLFYGLCY